MSMQYQDLMERTLTRTRRSTSSSTSSVQPTPGFTSRRRLTPEQIQILQDVYELNSHPSKEERAFLARELNLEIKAVNVWYQNKRRSMKKKSLAWSRATENLVVDPLRPASSSHLGRAYSLDVIASSRELKDSTDIRWQRRPNISVHAHWSSRTPLTPHRNRAHSRRSASPVAGPSRTNANTNGFTDTREIWEHVPSSPLLPPSSPSVDAARFAALPPSSKVLRSLEWACAKDRVNLRRQRSVPQEDARDADVRLPFRRALYGGGVDIGMDLGFVGQGEAFTGEDRDVPALALDLHSEGEDGDEIITPDTSLAMVSAPTVVHPRRDGMTNRTGADHSHDKVTSPRKKRVKPATPRKGTNKARVEGLPSKDVEAAMALLEFRLPA